MRVSKYRVRDYAAQIAKVAERLRRRGPQIVVRRPSYQVRAFSTPFCLLRYHDSTRVADANGLTFKALNDGYCVRLPRFVEEDVWREREG